MFRAAGSAKTPSCRGEHGFVGERSTHGRGGGILTATVVGDNKRARPAGFFTEPLAELAAERHGYDAAAPRCSPRRCSVFGCGYFAFSVPCFGIAESPFSLLRE